MSAPATARPRLRRWASVAAAVAALIVTGGCSLLARLRHAIQPRKRLATFN